MEPGEHLLKTRLAQAQVTDSGGGFYSLPFFALGSQCQLFFQAGSAQAAGALREAALNWIAQFELRYSRFLSGSEVSRINANAGIDWVKISPQTGLLLDLCGHSHFLSQGAFDATSLPLSLLWDWKRSRQSLPAPEEIDRARGLIGWGRVQRSGGAVFLPEKGMMLDFGGVGKEFAVDCLKQLALGMGIKRIMVDLGGDIAVEGDAPEGDGWYVGLEDPADTSNCHCGIRLKSGAAVATSGDYRRCFELDGRTYGHILDCRTGWPVANGTRSVTVIASRCVVAGMLSTSAMVLGGHDAIAMLERTPGVHGCLWSEGRLFETRGFRRSTFPQVLQEP
jgi:thiamine biosynthesis lipoprotein